MLNVMVLRAEIDRVKANILPRREVTGAVEGLEELEDVLKNLFPAILSFLLSESGSLESEKEDDDEDSDVGDPGS